MKNKRLTDCNKWTTGKWFRKLDPQLKLFWFYIHDRCDQSGVWIEDLEELKFYTGILFDPDLLLHAFKDEIQYFVDAKKWWIKSYCILQHNTFLKDNETNAPRRCAVRLLHEHNLYERYKEFYIKAFPGIDITKLQVTGRSNEKDKKMNNKKYTEYKNVKSNEEKTGDIIEDTLSMTSVDSQDTYVDPI